MKACRSVEAVPFANSKRIKSLTNLEETNLKKNNEDLTATLNYIITNYQPHNKIKILIKLFTNLENNPHYNLRILPSQTFHELYSKQSKINPILHFDSIDQQKRYTQLTSLIKEQMEIIKTINLTKQTFIKINSEQTKFNATSIDKTEQTILQKFKQKKLNNDTLEQELLNRIEKKKILFENYETFSTKLKQLKKKIDSPRASNYDDLKNNNHEKNEITTDNLNYMIELGQYYDCQIMLIYIIDKFKLLEQESQLDDIDY